MGLRPCQSIGGKCFADPNPYFGRVVYGPALRTDQPISVTRFDYQDEQRSASPPISGTWPTFTIVPYWNYQGAPSFSTFGTATNGAGLAWLPLSKGASQTVCPPLADTTAQRCVRFQWPFARSAYDQNRGKAARFSWLGSLLENKRNGSGLEYKRSRQYDPLSGRFTQEDPIGLAGGANLYGFGGGDPVNFGDPFGEKVCFIGPGAGERAKDVQRGTGTTFDLDNEGCAKNVRITGRANEVSLGFISLANDAAQRWDVVTEESRIGTNTTGRMIAIDPRDLTNKMYGTKYESYSRCSAPKGTVQDGPSVVVHELGHAFSITSGQDALSGQFTAVRWENTVHSRAGRPDRSQLCHIEAFPGIFFRTRMY